MAGLRIAVTIPAGNVRESFIPARVAGRLEELGEVSWNPFERQYTDGEMREVLSAAEVCVTGWGVPRLTGEIVGGSRTLKMVAHTGGTVAPFITKELYDTGVKVISGNKLYARSVAEGTVAYMLTALRNLPYFIGRTESSGWAYRQDEPFEGLLDQTVGLVGFGAISRYLAPMLKAFNASVYAYDPHAPAGVFESYGVTKADSLEEMFPKVKIVSLHLPINKETFHLIDARLLSLVRDGALFVNTARGACVDEKALAAELITGRFRAILDVFEREPLPMDSGLRGLDNVLLVPHMAGPTADRQPLVTLALADDIARFMEGKPLEHEIGYEYGMSMTNEAAVSDMLK